MRIKHETALTLTELLIGTAIVGIIMLGVVSIDYALRSSSEGTARNNLVNMRASAMMIHITKNTQLATGTKTNPGILDSTDIANSLCVRQEGPASNYDDDYSDAFWVCYTKNGNSLNTCQTAVGVITPTACAATAEVLGTVTTFSSSLVDSPGAGASAVGSFYVEVTLETKFDATKPDNPLSNPKINLQSRVNPASLGSSLE